MGRFWPPPAAYRALLAKLRSASPPHPEALADEIEIAYRRAVHNEHSIGTGLLVLGGAIAVAVGFTFPPLLLATGLIGATVGTGAWIQWLRRRGEVVLFCREASLVIGRAIPPERHCATCAVTKEHFEHTDYYGRKTLLLELPDIGRAHVSYFETDFQRIPTLVAASSQIVVAFSNHARPSLGRRVLAALPSATLECAPP